MALDGVRFPGIVLAVLGRVTRGSMPHRLQLGSNHSRADYGIA